MAIQFAPTIISPVASFWKEGNNSPIVTIKIQHNNQFNWGETPNLKVKMWRFDDETAEGAYIWDNIEPKDKNEITTISLVIPDFYSYYKLIIQKPEDWVTNYGQYYVIKNNLYILNTNSEWQDGEKYYQKIDNVEFTSATTYKIQVAYKAYGDNLKTWSQVKTVTYLGTPSISLNKKDLSFEVTLEGEALKRYRFNKQDWALIDKNATSFPLLPPKDFISNKKIIIDVETATGAIISKEYLNNIIIATDAIEIKKDEENGLLYFETNSNIENTKILYLAQGEECQVLGDNSQTIFVDPYIEALRPKQYYRTYAADKDTIKTELVNSNSYLLDYEYSYLCDINCTLSLKFNGLVSSFKRTIQEQKQDTIGGSYPFIFRNGNCRYAEMPLNALLARELGPLQNKERLARTSAYRESTNTSSTIGLETAGQRYKAEKEYRDEVYNWLTDGKPKIFKSPTEGIFVVQLMNISMTSKKELGNMLYEISGTMYEIDEVSNYATQSYMEKQKQ